VKHWAVLVYIYIYIYRERERERDNWHVFRLRPGWIISYPKNIMLKSC
jgi:hypothetical protein